MLDGLGRARGVGVVMIGIQFHIFIFCVYINITVFPHILYATRIS